MLSVFLENHKVSVRDVVFRRPPNPAGAAIIRLRLAGICNTDLELQAGYYGFEGVPGHEFVGTVVGAPDPTLMGQRVVGEINVACERCEWCRRGLGRHCPSRSVLGIVKHPGAFRELFWLPPKNLHVVPASISDEEAVFTEPVAAACEILEQLPAIAGARVAVLGDGKLGLLVAQVLAAHGCRVRHFGRHEHKLRISQDAGIETAVLGKEVPPREFDYVVEATGSARGLEAAVRMTRPRGTVVMKSTVHGLTRLNTAPVVVDEITLVGSRCGRFEPALELLRLGKIRVRPLIDARFPLGQATRAFALARRKGSLKVLLENTPPGHAQIPESIAKR